ncbi:hypothetical protein P3S67_007283 [Capsicum chacoense]
MLLLIEAHSQYSTILGKFETAYAADRCVSLLDQGFKSQECCFFYPLSNDTTIGHVVDIATWNKDSLS